MSFTYHDRGDDLVLSDLSTQAYRADPEVASEVQSLARRNVVQTGRACDVYADGGADVLFEARPQCQA